MVQGEEGGRREGGREGGGREGSAKTIDKALHLLVVLHTSFPPSLAPSLPPSLPQGKELAFAFGINLSCSRLGSVINNFVEPEVRSFPPSIHPSLHPSLSRSFLLSIPSSLLPSLPPSLQQIADAWGGVNVALFFGVVVLCIGYVPFLPPSLPLSLPPPFQSVLSHPRPPLPPSLPPFLPPFPSLLCGLVMAPVDKLVERRLLASRPSSLPTSSTSSSSELQDPLLESLPSLVPSLPPSHPSSSASSSSFCGKARQQLGTFSGMFWTLSLCCLVRQGGTKGGREGGDVELQCDGQDVPTFSSLPPPSRWCTARSCPSTTSPLLCCRYGEGGREGGRVVGMELE